MRRFVQVRLLCIVIALTLVPTLVLPFAERLRTAWTKFWEPKPEKFDWEAYAAEPHVFVNGIYVCPTDWSNVEALENADRAAYFDPQLIDGFAPTLGPHPAMAGVDEAALDDSPNQTDPESQAGERALTPRRLRY